MFVSNILHCVDTYEWPKYNKLYFTYWEHVYSCFSHRLGTFNGRYFFWRFWHLLFAPDSFLDHLSCKNLGGMQIYQKIASGISSGEPEQLKASRLCKYPRLHLSAFCIQARIRVVFSCSEGSRLTRDVFFPDPCRHTQECTGKRGVRVLWEHRILALQWDTSESRAPKRCRGLGLSLFG